MALHGSSAPDARTILPQSQLVLLALWLGAAILFAAAVAPAAFAVLPERELAGALVGRVLPVVFWSGVVIGTMVLALGLSRRDRGPGVASSVGGGVVLVACAIAQLLIAPRIAALRSQLSAPLATLAAEDPLRVAFGRLHVWSVVWLGVAMAAAAVALLLLMITLRSRGKT